MNLDFLKGRVEWMKVESAYGPTIFIPKPLGEGKKSGGAPAPAPAGPGAPGEPAPPPSMPSLSKILRPKLTIRVSGIDDTIVFAPYGEPGETQWPIVAGIGAGATVALFGFAVYGIYRMLKG